MNLKRFSRKSVCWMLALIMIFTYFMPIIPVFAVSNTTSLTVSFRGDNAQYGKVQYSLNDGEDWNDITENVNNLAITVTGDNLRLKIVPNEGYSVDYTGIGLDLDEEHFDYIGNWGFESEDGFLVRDDAQSVRLDNVEFHEGESWQPGGEGEFDETAFINLSVIGVELESPYGPDASEVRISINDEQFNPIDPHNVTYQYENVNGENRVSRLDTNAPIEMGYYNNDEIPEGKIRIGIRGQWNTYFTDVVINGVSYKEELPVTKQDLIDSYIGGDIRAYFIVDKTEDNTYTIEVSGRKQVGEEQILGNFLWDYNENGYTTSPEDKILHGYMDFVSAEYDGITYETIEEVNEAGELFNWHDPEIQEHLGEEWAGVGSATFPVGTMLTVRIIPDAGYQLVSFGTELEHGFEPDDDNVGYYTFEIQGGNFHLMADIEYVGDEVNAELSDSVVAGTIGFGGEEESMAIGTARLDVNELEAADLTEDQINGFETIADDYDIEEYLDIDLFNTVYKGTRDDSWDTEVDELNNDATIVLNLSDDILYDEVIVLHEEHDGTYSIVENAEYDIMDNTITIVNDNFSNYAIASRTITDVDEYTVTFHTNGGSPIEPVTVASGDTVDMPENPERYGYSFTGWYTDRACTEEFNFGTPIEKNTILFARWEFNRENFAEVEVAGSNGYDVVGIEEAENVDALLVYFNDGNTVGVYGSGLIGRKSYDIESERDRYFIYTLGNITFEAYPSDGYEVGFWDNGNHVDSRILHLENLEARDVKRVDVEFRWEGDIPPGPVGHEFKYPNMAQIEIGKNTDIRNFTEVENVESLTIEYNDGNTVEVTTDGAGIYTEVFDDNGTIRYFVYSLGNINFEAVPVSSEYEPNFFYDGFHKVLSSISFNYLVAGDTRNLTIEFWHTGDPGPGPEPHEFKYPNMAQIEVGRNDQIVDFPEGEDLDSFEIEYRDGTVEVNGSGMNTEIFDDNGNIRYFVYALDNISFEGTPNEEEFEVVYFNDGMQITDCDIYGYGELKAGDYRRIDIEFWVPGPEPHDFKYPEMAQIEVGRNNDIVSFEEVESVDSFEIEYRDGNIVEITGTGINTEIFDDDGNIRYFIYALGDLSFEGVPVDEDTNLYFFDDGQFHDDITEFTYNELEKGEMHSLDVEFRREGEVPIPDDYEDIEFDIAWYKSFINVGINGRRVIEESQEYGLDVYSYEGVVLEKAGLTDPNETNEIQLQVRFGDYPFNEVTINGEVYTSESENVVIDEYSIWHITVPGAEKYTITATGDENGIVPRTIIWANIDADRNADDFDPDMLIEHGRAKVIAVYDEEDHLVEGEVDVDPETGMGWIPVIPGHKVVFEFVPEHGYQLTGVSANELPLEAQDDINHYTFIMPDNNVHFAATFTEVEDVVEANATNVNNGTIEIGDELINGSVILTVNDIVLDPEQISNFVEVAGDYEISNYLDIDLYNIFYKGKNDNEDVWADKIDELADEVVITIQLEEGVDGNDIVIVHNIHDGEDYEIIPAEYDPETNTITFRTNSFSNYAIASKDTVFYDFEIDLNGGTFINGGGEDIPDKLPEGMSFEITAPSEDEVMPPEGKEFDAYEVNGIRYEDGDVFTVNEELAVDGKITAVILWKAKVNPIQFIFMGEGGTYRVQFETDDEEELAKQNIEKSSSGFFQVPEGNSITFVATPAEGYHFIGWWNVHEEDSTGQGDMVWVKDNLITISPTYTYNPITYAYIMPEFEADPEPVMHTNTFEANGGTGTMDTVQVEDGEEYTLPANGFTPPAGKVFGAWKVSNDLYVRYPNSRIIITEDKIITPIWNDITHYLYVGTKTNDASQGKVQINSNDPVINGGIYLKENTGTATIKAIPNEGYRFVEWEISYGSGIVNRNSNATVEVTMGTRDVNYYAVFEEIPALYTVTLNPNNGTDEIDRISNITSGTYVTLGSPASYGFTIPEGKEFDGWLINEVKYSVGQRIQVTSDLTAVAQWIDVIPETHTVTFELNGGTMTASLTQTVNHGECATRPDPNPTREGYSFFEWYIIRDGENVVYHFNEPVTEDITIYAYWEQLYTIVYDFNGGTRGGEGTYTTEQVSAAIRFTEESLISELGVIPPEGKTLEAVEVNGTRYELGSGIMLNQNITIKYIWSGEEEELTFTDIPKDSWYYDSVKYVSERGIITGYNETTFGPFDNLKREQLVNILWRIDGKPDASELANNFSDVPDGQWYTDAIKWANENGIVRGYGGTTKFGLGDNIIRQDLAIMISNYAKYKGIYVEPTVTLDNFADKDIVSGYAVEAVSWASENGIISGNANADGTKTIAPLANAMRCEAAVMLMRFCENVLED